VASARGGSCTRNEEADSLFPKSHSPNALPLTRHSTAMTELPYLSDNNRWVEICSRLLGFLLSPSASSLKSRIDRGLPPWLSRA
jgi:hypothetical protein